METTKQDYVLNEKFDYDHRSSENNGFLSPAWIAGVDFSLLTFSFLLMNFWQWLKAGIVMLAVTTVVIFAFRLFEYSRFQALGTVVLLTALEGGFVCFYFRGRKDTQIDQDQKITH